MSNLKAPGDYAQLHCTNVISSYDRSSTSEYMYFNSFSSSPNRILEPRKTQLLFLTNFCCWYFHVISIGSSVFMRSRKLIQICICACSLYRVNSRTMLRMVTMAAGTRRPRLIGKESWAVHAWYCMTSVIISLYSLWMHKAWRARKNKFAIPWSIPFKPVSKGLKIY